MLLAIDIGNSNVVIGCLDDNGKVLCTLRMVSDLKKTEDEYAAGMKAILLNNGIDCEGFDGAIICSVVPPLTEIFRLAVERVAGLRAMIVGPGTKTGLNILIDDPATLGSDLVAAAVAAVAEYLQPLIIIDMGTATTITAVDTGNRFLGGAIVPGVALSINALSAGTSLLHKVPIEAPKKCICGSTTACMQSGAVYGTAAMLDGMIDRFRQELDKDATVVATGGLAPKVIPLCKNTFVCDYHLLLKGMYVIYKKNRKEKI